MRALTLALPLFALASTPALAQDEGGGGDIGNLLDSIPEIKTEEPKEVEPKPEPQVTFPVYVDQVNKEVLASWQPKKSALKNPRAQTQLTVKIDETGQVTDVAVLKLSGDKKFDKSVLDAINGVSSVGAPPTSLQGPAEQGVIVTFSAAWAIKRGM